MTNWWCVRPADNVWIQIFTNHAVVWAIFGSLLAASSGVAAAGMSKIDRTGSSAPELRAYQWQAILHCLTTYFVLVPILGARRKRNQPFIRQDDTPQTVTDVVFYTTVALSFLTATAAPIVFQVATSRNDPVLAQSAATGLNFSSVVFSTAAAGQLAVRATERRRK